MVLFPYMNKLLSNVFILVSSQITIHVLLFTVETKLKYLPDNLVVILSMSFVLGGVSTLVRDFSKPIRRGYGNN